MSSYNDYEAPGCSRQALGIGFLCVGLIIAALGGLMLLALLHSPTARQDNAYSGTPYLALLLVVISSFPVLISLFLLKVHWLLVIGAFLLPLLAAYAYGQGWLFALNPTTPGYGFLIYGGGVILLSLILVVSVAVGKRKSSKMPK